MAGWVDQRGQVIADTVHNDGALVAKDVSFSLPQISFPTSDFNVMGPMSLPNMGQVEDMETTVTKIGIDMGLAALLKSSVHKLEFRFIQMQLLNDGTQKNEGCKAFISGVPKSIGGIEVEPGSPVSNDIALATMRYQLYVGGKELWLVDRLKQILRINGKDYYSSIKSYL